VNFADYLPFLLPLEHHSRYRNLGIFI